MQRKHMDLQSLLTIALLLAALVWLHSRWARRRIERWAARTAHTVTGLRLCLLDTGPFSPWGTSGGQYIFRIEARDAQGTRKTGYARAGGYFFGLLRGRVEVRWDA